MYTEIIVITVISLIIGLALFYIIRAKKKGQRCIGCPYASSCKSAKCSCQSKKDE